MDLKNAFWKLGEEGYIILRDFFSKESLTDVERTLTGLLAMQAGKLGNGDYVKPRRRTFVPAGEAEGEIDMLVRWLDANDADAMDQVLVMATSTPALRRLLCNPELERMCGELLGSPEELLLYSGPSVLVNLPTVERRLYTWHSESNWYPKRRNFLNLWAPIVRNKNADNGTMYFKRGSHKTDWAFAEYHGFSKNSQGDKRYFLQYEIPPQELAAHEDVAVDARIGDLVIFDRRLVHRSSVNRGKVPSYAINMRPYDYRRDLTVSANWGERPYRDAAATPAGGRAGLVPLG
jgi:ectoine hydroxylase-related dioxygenase (phytanoyl-CoA dioxygenase family)